MSAEEILGAVSVINPGAVMRARRVVSAIVILRSGASMRAARQQLRARFGCCRKEAWRIVDMAADMAVLDLDASK